MQPASHFALGLNKLGFHKLHYLEWGAPNTETVFCVHGLTRNAHDFDVLAARLSQHYRVICPDVVGRGDSDWLPNPLDYDYPQYLNDMSVLLARSNTPSVDWIGTSMGGLIGLFLAIQPQSPIRRLILNDVGAFIPGVALQRIQKYVTNAPSFASFTQATAYLKQILAPFGALTEEQWNHLVHHSFCQQPSGNFVFRYDPAIAEPLKEKPWEDANLWPFWAQVRCPTLLIRGAHSDILPREVVEKMQIMKPDLEILEVADAGHAPALMDPMQIRTIEDWLRKTA